jgi:hypothetical protein
MTLLWIIIDSFDAQSRISRNLKESAGARIKRRFWWCWFLFVYLVRSLGSIFSEQIGSGVWYYDLDNNEWIRCFISTGEGSDRPTIANGKGLYEKSVSRDLIKNVRGPREWWHRYRTAVRFRIQNFRLKGN